MEELENFLLRHSVCALSAEHPDSDSLLKGIYMEILTGPNFSSSVFQRVKTNLEEISLKAWKDAVTEVLRSLTPENRELILLNLTHVILAELQQQSVSTLYHIYSLRTLLLKHIKTIFTVNVPQATRFCLQIVKFIDLWCIHLQVEELDLAENLIRVIRFVSSLNLGEEDLRANLLCERILSPMVSLVKEYSVFQYVSSNLIEHILPFGFLAIGTKAENASVAYMILKEVMKTPEEGEVEESGIRDKFNYIYSQFDSAIRSPPQSLYLFWREMDTPAERAAILFQHYSETLPNLSNSNWDTLFIRKQVLADCFTLKFMSLLTSGGSKLSVQLIDLIISILANLVGIYYKNHRSDVNVSIILTVLVKLEWVPGIVREIGKYIAEISTENVTELLLIVWNYLKEHNPTSPHKSNEEVYMRSLKMLIHNNIGQLGLLYKSIQRIN